MQEAVPAGGAMTAVLGLDSETIAQACGEIDGMVSVANYNCPGQTVVSGEEGQIAALSERVAALKGRAMRLNVSGAFHSPYMHEAALGLADYMRDLRFAAPIVPVYANCTAEPYSAQDAASLLARQVENPVRWEQTVRAMIAQGVDTFVECGAGKTLSGLISKIDKDVAVCRVEDAATLSQTLSELGR